MSNLFGVLNVPTVNLTGIVSSSWIYVFIVGIIGFVILVSIAILLFFMTYNRIVVVFENVAGLGYQPVLKTRARILKIGKGGEEILKTLAGGHYVSAYGRKMGKNTYWYAKAQDGYWYNVYLGDLDAKLGMLDIEPVDRDVRMFHVAIQRMAADTWGKTSFLEKYAVHLMLFIFLVVFIIGMWFIVGKIGNATQSLSATAETNERLVGHLDSILTKTNNLQNQIQTGVTGVVPATNITGS